MKQKKKKEFIYVDGVMSGEHAFMLHDTFGYPIELTCDRAEKDGCSVDMEGFQRLMEEQRARSRADRARKAGRDVFARSGRES